MLCVLLLEWTRILPRKKLATAIYSMASLRLPYVVLVAVGPAPVPVLAAAGILVPVIVPVTVPVLA